MKRIIGPILVSACISGCLSNSTAAKFGKSSGTELDRPIADFSLTERGGRTVSRDDLLGKVWIASFIFTRCAGPCSQVSGSMARLQKELEGQDNVLLVSFTVDPEHDTAKVLDDYGKRFGADPKRWLFLTGPKEKIYPLIKDSFLLAVEETEGEARTAGNEVTHSTRLAVVDRNGHLRGYFEGTEPDDIPKLKERVLKLSGKKAAIGPEDLPTLNALLNGASALLLIAGYAAIKTRRIRFHKACMLSALSVSILFLASYLYYHFAVRSGQPTAFRGEGWVRPLYVGILFSHTILAAVVAPMALYTAYQGLRDRLDRHVKIARWTWPLWFYVSITGVLVYLLLYQIYPSQ